MTWQLGAICVLAIGLAAGFAWYERTRPDARILALVATLAALAALGRIAFAALPNVKPTTDIVLITGYVLGGAPGFVVGALAGLVSNFFFGQGPWTVWQMAAWAGTGVLGAGLARATAGRVSRWPLALICMVVGFAFTAVQDVGDWVNYSDHSSAQLGVYVGKGVGFDLIHAGGCLVFALAFGPALIRALSRFRARLQVSRLPAGALSALLALALPGLAALRGLAVPARAAAAGTPAGYLQAVQNGDGGFGPSAGSASSPLYSGWAALGLASAGVNPRAPGRGGRSVLGYIAATLSSNLDPGSIERTILVVHAAGANPYAFGGRDLVAALQGAVRRDGSVGEQTNLTVFAVLALRAAGASAPGSMLHWLDAQQNGDGGFGFGTAGQASDIDDTGAALEALAATGPAARVRRAVGFLRAAQNGDGGLPAQPGASSNAQSTAWAVQGLVAAGIDPDHLGRARSPLAYLSSLIAADGHVRYAAGIDQTPVWVTGEAMMALARQPLPLAPLPLPSTPSGLARHSSTTAARAPGAVPGRARGGALTPARRHASRRGRGRRAAGAAPGLGQLVAAEESSLYNGLTRVLARLADAFAY